jgi:putative heme-binding domain-containing protein
MGNKAVASLEKCWNSSANASMRSRAFWCLVNMPANNAKKYIQEAIAATDPDLRVIGIRAAKQLGIAVIETIGQLVNDSDAHVRRECALALHHLKSAESAKLWATLAAQHDGKDRWYLEALGIGAAEQWDSFFEAYLSLIKDPTKTAASRDIVWRARTPVAIPFLAILASDSTVSLKDRARYFRAFDFNESPIKSALLLKILENNSQNDLALNKMVINALDVSAIKNSLSAQKALTEVLASIYGTNQYVELVNKYELKSECNNLLKLTIKLPYKAVSKNAALSLLQLCGTQTIWNVINSKDLVQQKSLVEVLGLIGSTELVEILQNVLLSEKYSRHLKTYCAVALGKSKNGETKILQLLKSKKIETSLKSDLANSIIGSRNEAVRKEAASYVTIKTKNADDKKLPTLGALASFKTNTIAGKKVFTTYCIICHQANKIGYDFGPNLSEIGSKLPKLSLLDAIVHPSAGIGFGYEGWDLVTKDGGNFSGIITSKTDQDLEMKFPGGGKLNFKTKNIKSLIQMKQSMMTEGLYKQMSLQEMANLLDYLSGLKKK